MAIQTIKHTDTPNPSVTSKPPVVAVLGHVDHGKTTLLDTIRKSSVASGEAGHITQKIGAYQVVVPVKGEQKTLTFLDTPGHEAFAKIRSRGAGVADIAILVVAVDDGVKPQTAESIKFIKEAGIPFVVAINKMDLPHADPKKVQQELARYDVLVESLGGDVVTVPISAKTGDGIDALLEVILLVSEMQELHADPKAPLEATVIEAKKEVGRGVVTTLIVKQGTLHTGDEIYCDGKLVKIRALFDEFGVVLKEALPSRATEMLGFTDVPLVGASVTAKETETVVVAGGDKPVAKTIEEMFLTHMDDGVRLPVVVKADSIGSLEAVITNFPKEVMVVQQGIGDVTESDVFIAKESKSIILGFNIKVPGSVARIAEHEGVRAKTYKIIYELLDEITEVMEILKHPDLLEEIVGRATIQAEFPFSDTRIAGSKITEGRFVIGDLVRLVRGTDVIGNGRVKTLQQGKQRADKVIEGTECGILFDKKLDFKVGDSIIAYKARQLL